MHRYLISIKLHARRNSWRELVAKSWWLGCRMKCAMPQPPTYNALLSFLPLQRKSARAVLSRDAPVAKRSGPLGESTLTPVFAGSTFQSLPLPL